MIVHLVCYWVIGLPLGCLLCFRAGWGALGMWIGLSVALILIGTTLLYAWRNKQRQLQQEFRNDAAYQCVTGA
jgi:MATE family multidrug resistance protein